MRPPILNTKPCAQSVTVSDSELTVFHADGRTISAPIVWFPRLANATPAEREDYQLLGAGEGIYWPAVDEDISIMGLIAGKPSVEYQRVA